MFEAVNNQTCAVLGKPIKHSLSPQIHQHFAAQFKMDINYLRLSCEPEEFEQTVEAFFAAGGRGLNITTPFKEQAFTIAHQQSAESIAAQSCNTLFMSDAVLHGTTTDGDGWLADIQRLEITLAGSRVLLLGVGGASRIILQRLLSLPGADGPDQIMLANRTVGKINPLLTDQRITGTALNEIPSGPYDLIINGLSTGWQDSFPDLDPDLARGAVGYDLNYGAGSKPFTTWFMQQGQSCHDGWGMLVNQAALSFNIWWQKSPQTRALIEAGPGFIQG